MRRRYFYVIVSTLCVLGATACSAHSGSATPAASASGAPSTPAAVSSTPARPGLTAGLTGRADGIGRPVLAVKIDNTAPAHPQVGLGAADVVYVEMVEGQLTRLMAVFASAQPPEIGPTRSARESDLDLLREYGRVDFAFSGANSGVLKLVHAAPVNEVSPDTVPAAFFRSGARPAPYNLFLRPARALAARRSAPAGDIGLRFGPLGAGSAPAAKVGVRYGPSAAITLRYSKSRQGWLVAMDGRAARTPDGRQLAPANVLVQQVRVRNSRFHDVLGNVTPFTQTTGGGPAAVYRDGRVVRGRWSRPTLGAGTRFLDSRGADIALRPGQSWILLVPVGIHPTN